MTLIVSQVPWSATAVDALGPALAAAKARFTDDSGLILLPWADPAEGRPVDGDELLRAIADLAGTHRVFLAGAATVSGPDGTPPRTIGFLLDATGAIRLRVEKITPDLVDGFSDTTAALSSPMEFPVADTPIGKVGLLVGEDVIFPHVVRALALSGAELILNPARERNDATFAARQTARGARAYENLAYLACASPAHVTEQGFTTALPAASAIHDWTGLAIEATGTESFVRADVDIEALRRKRSDLFANFLIALRTQLYAPDYRDPPRRNDTPGTRSAWRAEAAARIAASARAPRPNLRRQYNVVLAQTLLRDIDDPNRRDEIINRNLDESFRLVQRVARNPNVKLIVFPEFWLQGFAEGRTIETWAHLGIRFPGPEIERLAKFAQDNSTYICGGVYEYDPKWPGRYFNTSFILDDTGQLIHRYRKIQGADCNGHMPLTTPGNVFSRYVDMHGYDGIFPVADTPLGRLGSMICFDVNFPETARALTKRGAEVLIHNSAEPHNVRRRGWEKARLTRAFENTAYVLSVSQGGDFLDPDSERISTIHRGFSKVVNFDGSIQVIADSPGELVLMGAVDLDALARARAHPLTNVPIWDEPAVYGSVYQRVHGYPIDAWVDQPMADAKEGRREAVKTLERYRTSGVMVAPQTTETLSSDASNPFQAGRR